MKQIRIIALFVCFFVLAQQAVFAYPAVQAARGGDGGFWGNRLLADATVPQAVQKIEIQEKDTFTYSATPVTLTVKAFDSADSELTINASDLNWSTSDPNIALVAKQSNGSGEVTFNGRNGPVTITATYLDKSATASTIVTNASLHDLSSIQINGTIAGTETTTIPLTASALYSGESTYVPLSNVTWSSSDTNVATVTASGVVTLLRNGSVTIAAEFQGKSASLNATVTSKAALRTIAINGLSYNAAPVQLTAVGTYSDNTTVTLTNAVWATVPVSSPVATVDQSGKVTFSGTSGTVSVTATYQGVTGTATTTVPVALSAIAINESLAYSATPVQLTVKGTYNNGTTPNLSGVTWTSSDPSVAAVDSYGRVTFTGLNGPVTITATYQGKTASATVTVNNSLSLLSIAIMQSLSYSDTPVVLSINGYYSNGSTQSLTGATWTSSNPAVASVNAQGQVSFTGTNGAVTITATYNGLTNSVSTVVNRAPTVQLVSLTIDTPFAYSSYPVQLVVTGVYSDRSTQTLSNAAWSSNNTAVATVDAAGRVTFTGTNGAVTITATYNGLSTSVSTTVNRNTVDLTKVTIFGSLSYSTTTQKLIALAHYSNSTTEILPNPNWSSSNTDVATVNSKGEVTFTGKDGSVTITAEYQGFKDSVSTVVSSGEQPTAISITTYFEYDEDPYKLKLYATYKNGGRVLVDDATWSSNNTSVAKVSSDGTVTFTGKTGRVTITASYKGLTDSVTTTVDSDTVESISIRESLDYDDDNIELTVRVKYTDGSTKVISSSKVDWSSDNTRVAKVNSKGVVTFTDKEGKVTITAKYEGKTDKVKTTVTSTDIRDKERTSSGSGSSSGSNSGSSSSNSTRKPFASSLINSSSVEWNISTLAKNSNSMRVSDFSDTPYHWAHKEIRLARALNLTKGEPNGTFRPDDFITREEFVSLICRAFQINPISYGNTFRDTQNSWASGYIAALASKGVVKGNQDGTFKPESNITRAEMVTIISRLLDSRELPDYGSVYFADLQNHWAKDTIAQISRAGLVKGVDYGRFAPEDNTTRAEAIVILLRTLRLSPSIDSAISSVL